MLSCDAVFSFRSNSYPSFCWHNEQNSWIEDFEYHLERTPKNRKYEPISQITFSFNIEMTTILVVFQLSYAEKNEKCSNLASVCDFTNFFLFWIASWCQNIQWLDSFDTIWCQIFRNNSSTSHNNVDYLRKSFTWLNWYTSCADFMCSSSMEKNICLDLTDICWMW